MEGRFRKQSVHRCWGMKKLENPLLEKFRFDKIAVCEQGNRQILAQILKIGAVNFSRLWCGGGQDPNFWKRASSFIYKFWSGLHSLKLSGTALRMNIVPVTCFPCILLQQLPIVKQTHLCCACENKKSVQAHPKKKGGWRSLVSGLDNQRAPIPEERQR